MAILSRRPAALLLHWQNAAELELLKLSTPAAKFEAGLRCALGGGFGVDVSLAAAAQRDAGATIVNVTSAVQHIPHVGSLQQAELAGTVSLLQETLMQVYTSYRGVVSKHTAVAALVQSPAVLRYLERVGAAAGGQQNAEEDCEIRDAQMDVVQYLDSEGEAGRCQREAELFMAVQAACTLALKAAELKVLDVLDSHLLRPSIVSITYTLSQRAELKALLGCPSDASSVAFKIVGAAWHALCRAESAEAACNQRQLVLDAAVSVLGRAAWGSKAGGGAQPKFAILAEQGMDTQPDTMDSHSLHALPFVAHSLPMQLHDVQPGKGGGLTISVPHGLMQAGGGAQSPGAAASVSIAFLRQVSSDSVELRDPLRSGSHQQSFEGAEVCPLQQSTSDTQGGSWALSRSYTASFQTSQALQSEDGLGNFMSQAERWREDAQWRGRSLLDPSGNSLLSPTRARLTSVSDPSYAPSGMLSPVPRQRSAENRTPSSSPTRRPLAPLRRQQRCVESPTRAGGQRATLMIDAETEDAVCRRISFEDAADSKLQQTSSAAAGAPGGTLRERRTLPAIHVAWEAAAGGHGGGIALPLSHAPPSGSLVSLRQVSMGGDAAAVRLPRIRAAQGGDAVSHAPMDPLWGGAGGPVQSDCLTDEDEDDGEDDCDFAQLGSGHAGEVDNAYCGIVAGVVHAGARRSAVALVARSPSLSPPGASPGLSDGARSPDVSAGMQLPWESNPMAASPLVRFGGGSSGGSGVKRPRSGEVPLPPLVPCRTVLSRQAPPGVSGDEASGAAPCVVLARKESALTRIALALGFVPVSTCTQPGARAEHLMSEADAQALQAHGGVCNGEVVAAARPVTLPRRMSALPVSPPCSKLQAPRQLAGVRRVGAKRGASVLL